MNQSLNGLSNADKNGDKSGEDGNYYNPYSKKKGIRVGGLGG